MGNSISRTNPGRHIFQLFYTFFVENNLKRKNTQRIMRLFKTLLAVSAVHAGDKYQASEQERDCLSDCKRATGCQGESISKGNVPTCIQDCRDQCTSDRKELIGTMFARSSNKLHKKAQRKKENTAKRAEHREMVKAAQPPPMIKEIHEIRDEGDQIAEMFLACLKEEKDKLKKTNPGCEGQGPGEAWDCKRQMVENCLDKNDNYENMGSTAIVTLAHKMRKSERVAEETQNRLIALSQMENDAVVVEAPAEVDIMEQIKTNKHGRYRVGAVRNHLQSQSRDNNRDQSNRQDTSEIGLDMVKNLVYRGEEGEDQGAEDDREAVIA